MDKREELIAGAMRAFDAGGFRGMGVDGILAPSGTSTRTLYKHFGSRDGLVLAVLEERHRNFMRRLHARKEPGSGLSDPVGQIFDTLEEWLSEHGARGCLLLRARAEYASANDEVVALVRQQKHEFEADIGERVEAALGRPDRDIAAQVWMLFEGATAAASVSESRLLVRLAKQAAHALLAAARERAR